MDLTNPDAKPHGLTWVCPQCNFENWFPHGHCRNCQTVTSKHGVWSHNPSEQERKENEIDRPHHYARWKIEPVTFIQENRLPFCEGNVVKYICRHDAKNGLEDVKKALRYAQMVAEDHYGVHIPIAWDDERPVDGITT